MGGSNLVGRPDFLQLIGQVQKLQNSEFNFAMSWTGVVNFEPAEGMFTFGDFWVQGALASRMPIVGHPLVWGAGVFPDWMKAGRYATRAGLIDAMTTYIQTVMAHYAGQFRSWVVVNEYNAPWGDRFYDVIGPDYLEIAFSVARRTDPSAKLIYNDTSNHDASLPRYAATHQIVDRLNAANLIDEVGLQMHLGSGPIDHGRVIDAMRSYGLPVIVTEFDVNLKDVAGSDSERYAYQASMYSEALTAALYSNVCEEFIVFQTGDQFSVWEDPAQGPNYSPKADPTPFYDDLSPKPAYFAMRDVLNKLLAPDPRLRPNRISAPAVGRD